MFGPCFALREKHPLGYHVAQINKGESMFHSFLAGFAVSLATLGAQTAFAYEGRGDFQRAVETDRVVFEDVTLRGAVMIALSAQDDALLNGQQIPGYPQCGSDVDCNVRVVKAILQERADNTCRLAKARRSISFTLGHQPHLQHLATDGVNISQVDPRLLQDYKIGSVSVGIVKNFATLTCRK